MRSIKNLAVILFFVAFAHASVASPMLSSDGATLTNISAAGYGLFDVFFEEGLVGDVFGGVIFDEARKSEADAVSNALSAALIELEVLPIEINGCESILICFLFNPDTFTEEAGFADFSFAMGYVSGDPIWFTERPSRVIYSEELFANDSRLSSQVTLIRYAPSAVGSVPIPSTASLLVLGLLFWRLHQHRHQIRDQAGRL